LKYAQLLLTITAFFLFILLAGYGSGPANSAMNYFIGAPGGGGATCATCHGSPGNFGLITADIQVFNTGTTVPATNYTAGTTYDIEVEILHPIGSPGRFGFQLVALDSTSSQAGAFMNPMSGVSIVNLTNGIEVVEHSSFITSPIFTVQWAAPSTGTVNFYAGGVAANGNEQNSGDGGSPSPAMYTMTPGSTPIPQITVSLNAFLEGPYNVTSGLMETQLNQQSLVPSAQPYNTLPWNYPGTPSGTPGAVVDWVLVSLRTADAASTIVGQAAGLLLADGSVSVDIQLSPSDVFSEYYVVLEHRNHLPIMSPVLVQVINNEINYDFTQANSYTTGAGFGQKSLGQVWAAYAGNGDQLNAIGHELTGSDILEWFVENGNFGIYINSDFNMDGDINANDRIVWSINNGIFSAVPR